MFSPPEKNFCRALFVRGTATCFLFEQTAEVYAGDPSAHDKCSFPAAFVG
jgi:hypothetical protein